MILIMRNNNSGSVRRGQQRPTFVEVTSLNNELDTYSHYDFEKGVRHLIEQGPYHYKLTIYTYINRGTPKKKKGSKKLEGERDKKKEMS